MAPGANCKGNVSSINANIVIGFLGYTCQKTISMNYTFRDCRSKVNITGLLGDLGTNKQHCKLSQIQFFLDCDGIDNVTLRLWKFSDFCSRHTVGVAGEDIMFHILVFIMCASKNCVNPACPNLWVTLVTIKTMELARLLVKSVWILLLYLSFLDKNILSDNWSYCYCAVRFWCGLL